MTQLTCIYTALTAAVLWTSAVTKAVSQALTVGPETTRLHLVHTGAAVLSP